MPVFNVFYRIFMFYYVVVSKIKEIEIKIANENRKSSSFLKITEKEARFRDKERVLLNDFYENLCFMFIQSFCCLM